MAFQPMNLAGLRPEGFFAFSVQPPETHWFLDWNRKHGKQNRWMNDMNDIPWEFGGFPMLEQPHPCMKFVVSAHTVDSGAGCFSVCPPLWQNFLRCWCSAPDLTWLPPTFLKETRGLTCRTRFTNRLNEFPQKWKTPATLLTARPCFWLLQACFTVKIE